MFLHCGSTVLRRGKTRWRHWVSHRSEDAIALIQFWYENGNKANTYLRFGLLGELRCGEVREVLARQKLYDEERWENTLSRMYKNTESLRCPGGLKSWEATGRLWFSILAWMRRVGAGGLFWQQLMWCETASNDTRSTSKSYFIWHLFFTKPDGQFQ